MTSGDTLTGRDRELAFIRRALSKAGKGSGVAIVGAPGVGKTRLAREVLGRATAGGQRTNWIVGTESARALPLGAFTGSISVAMSDLLLNVRSLINSIVAQERRGRVLIGIDDAHLLDGVSAHVVHQLAKSDCVRLVVTLRSGGTEPDAVTALWKEGLLARLDLEPLSSDTARNVIEKTIGGAVDARSAQRLWRMTGGNALFLGQLLKDQLAAGRVRQLAGVWMWDENVAVTQNLSDMVGKQLGQLTPELTLVLDTLSQCEPLDATVLCDLVGRAHLTTAEQMRLVTVERIGNTLSVRLAHPLFGELRRATAGEMHLTSVRGRLANRLAQDADRDMYATVRRALLTLESDLDPNPDLYLESARLAMTMLDLSLAERFAAAAAACGVCEALEIQAMNTVLLGRGEHADTILAGMTETGCADRHRWTTVRAANLTWMLGRPTEAAAILGGLAALDESPADRAARAAVEACVDVVGARCASAAEKARQALDTGTLSDFHAMMASVALTMALGALGEVDDLASIADRTLTRSMTSFQASHMRFWFGAVHARASRLTGRLDECERWAQQLADSARELPGLAYANLAFLTGHAHLVGGKVRESVKVLHDALAGAEKHAVTTGLRPAICFALAEAHAKLGEPDAAVAALDEAKHSVPADYLFMHTGLSLATGWTLAAGGSLTDAVAVVRAAGSEARSRAQPTHELACLQLAAQWGDTTGAARSRELAAALSLPLANVVAQHAESLTTDDGEGLLAASAGYVGIGDRATAADAAAQAAVAFTRRQQGNRGRYAAALAQQLADECGGLCTPALRSPVAPTGLTGRQREIAELVAAGLTNREIADRLLTSVRTVEGHVFHACRRIGADSRADLAAIMRAGPGRAFSKHS